MKSRTRSISGVLLMLVIIPMFAGLLACMPVPIGDPERSRIDPDMSGPWIAELDGDTALYLFRPYDKRTWLVLGNDLEAGPGAEFEEKSESAGDLITILRDHDVGDTGLVPSREVAAYKAWLTRLGGEVFMTWEEVGGLNSDGTFKPEYWYVWKVVKASSDSFSIFLVNPDHDAFDDIVSPDDYEGDDYVSDMRRKWERALKKHASDDDLYMEDAWSFHRVPADLNDRVSELFGEIFEFEERD